MQINRMVFKKKPCIMCECGESNPHSMSACAEYWPVGSIFSYLCQEANESVTSSPRRFPAACLKADGGRGFRGPWAESPQELISESMKVTHRKLQDKICSH